MDLPQWYPTQTLSPPNHPNNNHLSKSNNIIISSSLVRYKNKLSIGLNNVNKGVRLLRRTVPTGGS